MEQGGKQEKPVLVLDLDGTLISSFDTRRCSLSSRYDFQVQIRHSETYTETLAVTKRPGLDNFLEQLAHLYEVVIFSYSVLPCVNAIIDKIDPDQRLVSRRLGYDSCPDGLKRLDSGLFGADMSKIIWVDDSPLPFRDSPDNGIVVPHFNAQGKDSVLTQLLPFLKAVSGLGDLREAIPLYKANKCKVVDGALFVRNSYGRGWHPFGQEETATMRFCTIQ